MSEKSAIEQANGPATPTSLAADLTSLGVTPGSIVIAHSSLSAIGWTAGGPQAVLEALLNVIGPTGTLVMPTQSGQLSDPGDWVAPPVPKEWHQTIRDHMPAYDPHLTPTRSMGAVVDCFLRHPDTIRSPHPSYSFGANGPAAEAIVGSHTPESGFGEESPLGRLYEHDASVLFLGSGFANNTAFHLGEYRATWAKKKTTSYGAPMLVNGERQWLEWTDHDHDEEDFPQIGEAYDDAGGPSQTGSLGIGTARLFPMRALVDFATDWMTTNR